MKRRDFIALIGSMAAAWPRTGRAQQPAMPVVGFLNSANPKGYADMLAAFRKGLEDAGLVEGQNVAIEYRWADNSNHRLPELTADLVRRRVNVIAANGPAAFHAKAATSTIPIVFYGGYNPVEVGLVASLARPGGNVTGVTVLNVELGPKRLELARELIPRAMFVALLINQTNPNVEQLTRDARAAAQILGLQVHVIGASTEREIDSAVATVAGLGARVLVIGPDPFFNTRTDQFAALTLRHALPMIYQYRQFAAAGGLMSYSGSIIDQYRRVGIYAGRIIKGESPAHLPVQQTAKVELFINLKTAKALGIDVPPTLLARADEVIE